MLGKRTFEGASCWIRIMTDLPMQLRDGVRLVHDLKTEKGMRGKGQGTKLMHMVCDEADKELRTLLLMPDSDMLQKWYSKFGFVKVQDEPKVLMMREPKI
jgi:predicted GNAT family N-acyltransferase